MILTYDVYKVQAVQRPQRILRTTASQEIPRRGSSFQEKDVPPQLQSAEALTFGEMYEAYVGSAVAKPDTVRDRALRSRRGSVARVSTARPFRKQRRGLKQI